MSQNAVKDARTISLALVALAFTALMLSISIVGKRERDGNLAYLEKLFLVSDAIEQEIARPGSIMSQPADAHFVIDGRLSVIGGNPSFDYFSETTVGASFSEQRFLEPHRLLATRSDPGVSCHVTAIQNDSDEQISIFVYETLMGGSHRAMPANRFIVANYNAFCFLASRATGDFEAGPSFLAMDDAKVAYVALPTSILNFVHENSNTYLGLVEMDLSRFSAAPSARLGHFPFESDGAFPA